jgi:hypothetical protein
MKYQRMTWHQIKWHLGVSVILPSHYFSRKYFGIFVTSFKALGFYLYLTTMNHLKSYLMIAGLVCLSNLARADDATTTPVSTTSSPFGSTTSGTASPKTGVRAGEEGEIRHLEAEVNKLEHEVAHLEHRHHHHHHHHPVPGAPGAPVAPTPTGTTTGSTTTTATGA